jgi:hypothetical protein
MRSRCSGEKPAIQSKSREPPLPCKLKESKVAIPKIVKVAIAGTAGDKFTKGPSSTDKVIKKIDIATKFKEVWLIGVYF